MTEARHILFGCVAFNDAGAIGRYVAHLRSLPRPSTTVIDIAISDNSATAGEAEATREICRETGCVYLRDGANTGYFPGLNRILGLDTPWDYAVLGNFDLDFSPDFIQQLSTRTYDTNVVVVAPRIQSSIGDENPLKDRYAARRWQDAAKSDLAHMSYTTHNLVIAYEQWRKRTSGHAPRRAVDLARREIYAPHGSCFILTRNFSAVMGHGTLPAENFLWAEEFLLAGHVRKSGGVILFDPELRLEHHRNATTDDVIGREKFRIKQKSYWNARQFMT